VVDVIVLAGGLGTRLRSTIPTLPKAMAPIHNIPFLQILLGKLKQGRFISKIVMALGYQAKIIADFLSTGTDLDFSIEPHLLGTGGAVLWSLPKTSSQTVLIVNGDTFFDLDLQGFYDFHVKKQASATLAVRWVENVGRYGSVQVDSEQRILQFEEKSDQSKNGLVSAGMYLIQREMFSSFLNGSIYSMEKDFIPIFLKKNVFAYLDEGVFIDIGTADSYQEAQKTLEPWI
jgi:D-glycero-alpha-D-manno-heptose 1-phosphate guanylyltransferase